MAASQDRNPARVPSPWGDLESPFLDEAIFVREAETEEAHLARIAAESPFAGRGFEPRDAESELGLVAPEFEQEDLFTLPPAAAKLPSDAALRVKLSAIKLPEARALDKPFAVLGKRDVFAAALEKAVRVMPDTAPAAFNRLRMHLVRLGAEAFALDVRLPSSWQAQIGFVDHPARLKDLSDLADARNYLHFAARRLLQLSASLSNNEVDRRQMNRAIVLLRVLQGQMGANYSLLLEIPELLAYRALMVHLIWKHYQALLDRRLAAATQPRYQWDAAKEDWQKDLDAASITGRLDPPVVAIPAFRLTRTLYRDYFTPAAATDIAYKQYTRRPAPLSNKEISMDTVLRRRREQMELVLELQRVWPSAPLLRLHDTSSWQAWIRKTWDRSLLARETNFELLEPLIDFLNRYFKAFTIAVPHDLLEGCGQKNYLTRSYPRAATGGLVHDCFVYAARFLHMLGGLLIPGATPPDFSNPSCFLVEMPAHVGALIRAEWIWLGKPQAIAIIINNDQARLTKDDREVPDSVVAHYVVQDQYGGVTTPFQLRRITSKPSDASGLWREICRLSESPLDLPYSGPSEPQLLYLRYAATISAISRGVFDSASSLWSALLQKVEPSNDPRRRLPTASVIAEIQRYRASIEKLVNDATAQFEKDALPLAAVIEADLQDNQKRIPKKALRAKTAARLPWMAGWERYKKELNEALKSGDLSGMDPREFFPEDNFAPAVD